MAATLDALRAGDRATVEGFATASPPGRLLEMGLLPGTTVEVVRLAPLGDPMDLRVRGVPPLGPQAGGRLGPREQVLVSKG